MADKRETALCPLAKKLAKKRKERTCMDALRVVLHEQDSKRMKRTREIEEEVRCVEGNCAGNSIKEKERRREGEKADATFGFSCLCLSVLYIYVCVVQNETLKQKIKVLEEKQRQYFCVECDAMAPGYVSHAHYGLPFSCSPLVL